VRQKRLEYWSRLIAEPESSGLSILAFCQQRGVGDHSFYRWHGRLANNKLVRFAELKPIDTPARASAIEIILATRDRVRIPNGVDAMTLRLVLDALRP